MENRQACVWTTRKELWDSFLNDPELARVIDIARNQEVQQAESKIDEHAEYDISGKVMGETQSHDDQENEKNIGARLRAYETPITDEILRQSIR